MTGQRNILDKQENHRRPSVLPLGVDGVLVRFATVLDDAANRAAIGFRQAAAGAGWPGVVETAASLGSALVRFDPGAAARADVEAGIRALLEDRDWYAEDLPGPRRRWTIPVAFGGDHGPQLEEAAALAGLSAEDAIRDIERQAVRVLAVGFAAGQPYLGMLGGHWDIPGKGR